MSIWLFASGIGLCMMLVVFLLPWSFFIQHCTRLLFALGQRVQRWAPAQWQTAWLGMRHLEYRLGCSLAICCLTPFILLTPTAITDLLLLGLLSLMTLLVLPLWRANRRLQQRQAKIIAALPAQLDLLAMLLTAGHPLLASLQQSSALGRNNPLREELRTVVSQVRAGLAIDEAFQRLAERYPCRELRLFCNALHHARQSGAGLAHILSEQADQRRQELFLKAEKMAMEAPVKLLFPLLMFIFPGTVLVLVVTLVAKMMWKL